MSRLRGSGHEWPAELYGDRSGCGKFPPPQGHREHLRSLWIGLAHTHGMIERGAAAFAESMQLLERLNGQGEQL